MHLPTLHYPFYTEILKMPSIYHDLRELLSNPRLYDLEIVCQHGASVKVHRLVIFLQCPLLIEMTTENRVAEVCRFLILSFFVHEM